jgi:hypothetical protein
MLRPHFTCSLSRLHCAENELKEADIEVLNQRLAGARRSAGSIDLDDDDMEQPPSTSAASTAAAQQAQPLGGREPQGDGQAAAADAEAAGQQAGDGDVFTRSTDEDLADALNRRIVEVAGSLSMDDGNGEDGEAEEDVLTGGWAPGWLAKWVGLTICWMAE